MAYTEAQQEKIKNLSKRAKELYDGIDIDIPILIKDGSKLYWDSDTEFTEIDNSDDGDQIEDQYESVMKPLREVFQAKIDAVISESNELAKEVGEDPDEFFANNIQA